MNEFDIMVKKQEELEELKANVPNQFIITSYEELKAKVRYLEGYCPKVSLMKSANGNDVPNQFIITTYGKTIFQSYNSVIAIKYSDGSVVLGEDWDYSTTTGKYRNQFLGEGIATTREKIANGTYTIDRSL